MNDKTKQALEVALECIEKLWNIIDDIDTYGDMAKSDEKLYRSLVERRQRTRFEETGISTDGYTLNGVAITAIREALASGANEQPAQQEPIGKWMGNAVEWTENPYKFRKGQLIYTSPPANANAGKPWVGLTAKDLSEIPPNCYAGAIWADAKLKGKNT